MAETSRHLPNWAVLIIDLFVIALSLVAAFNLRYNFAVPDATYADLTYLTLYVLGVRTIFLVAFRTFAGVFRYTSSADAVRIFAATCAGSFVFVIGNIIAVQVTGKNLIPYGILATEFVLSTFVMTGIRLGYRVLYNRFVRVRSGSRSVIIYGAGEAGQITKKTLDRDVGTKYKIKAFVDDNPTLHGKSIEGIDVFLAERRLSGLIEGGDIDQVIVSVQDISPRKLSEIVNLCLPFKVKVLHVPPPSQWINGELTYKQIRRVRIEELLGREPIKLDEIRI
jgi:FlaA1/EpsC-like NDP-sugar epimerase